MQQSVYPGLNAAKGLLVIMVVLTHALPPSRILYFLYLFHMPVFLSISGFLVKTSAFQNGLGPFLNKVLHRMGIPWVIASLLYLPFSLGDRSVTELSITDLLYPFYHLWYVPAYFLGVILCYAVVRTKARVAILLPVLAIITLVWFGEFRINPQPVEQQPLYWMGDKRFYCYQFFFLLGFSLRNGLLRNKVPAILLIIITLLSAVGLVLATLVQLPFGSELLFYLSFNVSFVLYVLQHFLYKQWLQYPLLLLFNKQSLGVYLFHPMIIMIIYHLLGDPTKEYISKPIGMLIGVVTLILVMSLIQLTIKTPVLSRYLLGNIKKSVPASS